MEQKNKKPPASAPIPGRRPATKEEAIAQMVEKDPQKAAEILREILKKR